MPRNDKELNEVPSGKIKMGRSFFANMRDRVETIRPTAGDNISVERQAGYGLKISAKFDVVTLNVCRDGVPDVLQVLTPQAETET
jgi:hypothetical protein